MTTGSAQSNAFVKPVKRSYAEKMLRKYEHNASKRTHDLRRKLGRKTKDFTRDVEV